MMGNRAVGLCASVRHGFCRQEHAGSGLQLCPGPSSECSSLATLGSVLAMHLSCVGPGWSLWETLGLQVSDNVGLGESQSALSLPIELVSVAGVCGQ